MKYLHVTPVIGLPQVTGWSQVAENPHTAQNRFICAFALHGEQAGNIGRDISEDIAQFEPHTLEEAYSFLEKLEERYQDPALSFYFAAGIFMRSQVAYAVKGGSVLLKRQHKAGPIVHSEGEIKVVTGKYTLDDVIVLATNQATSFFSEVEQKFKAGYDTDSIITTVIPGLHSQTDSSLSALAFVIPSEKQQEEAEEEVFFEATIETDTEQSSVTVEEDEDSDEDKGSASKSTKESAKEPAVEPPVISPSDVKAPSQETMAELGLDQPAAQEETTNSLAAKLWSGFVAVAGLVGRGLKLVWQALVGLAKSLALRVSRFEWSKFKASLNGQSQYLNQEKNSRWRRLIIIAAIFIAAILIGWYIYSSQQAEARREAQQNLSSYSTTLEEAKTTVTTDPVAARESVASVIQELEVLQVEQQEQGNDIFVEEIERQLSEARALHQEISGREEFAELPVFYDLRLVDSDFVVTNADAAGNTAALVDNQQKQLVILNLAQKQPTTIALNDIGEIVDVRVRQDQVLILADGIYAVGLDEAASPELLIPEGDSNRQATLLGAYQRFVYVVNPDSRNIFRYAESEDGEFSDPVGWMQAARGLVYDTVSSWTIDGDIWIVTSEGELLRFTSGEAVDFTINGLTEPFTGSLRIATLVEGDSLYILEPEKRRLVELGKNGDFLREVVSASLASANSLMISQSQGKAFAVSGSIIFEIEL